MFLIVTKVADIFWDQVFVCPWNHQALEGVNTSRRRTQVFTSSLKYLWRVTVTVSPSSPADFNTADTTVWNQWRDEPSFFFRFPVFFLMMFVVRCHVVLLPSCCFLTCVLNCLTDWHRHVWLSRVRVGSFCPPHTLDTILLKCVGYIH